MNFQCGDDKVSPGVFHTFDTWRDFRAWACKVFHICSPADVLYAGVAYFNARVGVWVRIPAHDDRMRELFLVAPGYAMLLAGRSPVNIKMIR